MAVNKRIKYLLFLFILLFWISGCVILGFSINLKVSKNGNKIMYEAGPFVDLQIAVGVIIMVLGFLGCCGAIKENRCMLILFFIGLLHIFILLLIVGILGAVGEKEVRRKPWELSERRRKLLPLRDQNLEVQTYLQKLQVEAKCCGLINGPSDWGYTVPCSCDCVDTTQVCQSADGRKVYSTPCSFMGKPAAFSSAVLMLFGMAFTMTLYCQIRKRDANTT
ncbi:tetraspanin-8-like [Salvelinus namaycush]|uniref:Tetraspanin-8-like n=1 Tax=Salvelinus namaycush TaxID=8040 RepID=A0A8U0PZM1_SALNM|nr:tetraspanin-8-like [Salvelinus namaycush]